MGKKGKMESAKKAEPSEEVRGLFGNSAKVDSGLAALFAAAVSGSQTNCHGRNADMSHSLCRKARSNPRLSRR